MTVTEVNLPEGAWLGRRERHPLRYLPVGSEADSGAARNRFAECYFYHNQGRVLIYVRFSVGGVVRRGEWHVDRVGLGAMDPNGFSYHREDGPAVIEFDKHGRCVREEWWVEGQRHRVNGPAKIVFGPSGYLQLKSWYRHGKLHRDDMRPAVLQLKDYGAVFEWWENGRKKRVENGADRTPFLLAAERRIIFRDTWDPFWDCFLIRHDEDLGDGWTLRVSHESIRGQNNATETSILEEKTLHNGVKQSMNGLASLIRYRPDGKPWTVSYHQKDLRHRDNAPAFVRYDKKGRMELAQWYQHGQLSREDGPASMVWKAGKLVR